MSLRQHKHIACSHDAGFSLMELIVVLGIFTTVVVAASDIFLLAASAQRKIFGLERAQSDARFTMETLSREFRTGQIDYDYYAERVDQPSIPDGEFGIPETELALLDTTNTPIRFFRTTDETICYDATSTPCLAVAVGMNDPAPITPRNVVARGAFFYISPTASPTEFDPERGVYGADQQQSVTIVLALETIQAKRGENTIVTFQTTVTNRVYKR